MRNSIRMIDNSDTSIGQVNDDVVCINNEDNGDNIDWNKVYSEDGVKAMFRVLGCKKIGESLIPTRQMYKRYDNSEVKMDYIVDNDYHYRFYEQVFTKCLDEKMNIDQAREYVKGIKKELRKVQGSGWKGLFANERAKVVKECISEINPKAMHNMCCRDRVPIEVVMFRLFGVKGGKVCCGDEICCRNSESFVRFVEDMEDRYKGGEEGEV